MDTATVPIETPKQDLRSAILVGGLAAGTLDAALAFTLYGWGMPRGIASGILGAKAFHEGTGIWLFGLGLHYLIAFAAATVYCLSSRRLEFLKAHFVVGGLFYGIAVYLVMNLVVVPLSAFPLPVGPFPVAALIKGLLGHMLVIGLPISFSLKHFSERA
jgi:uncharacterized membrane protein YagU involved in acid resistance